MEFTLIVDLGFGEKIEFSTTEFWKTVAMANFVGRLEEVGQEVDELDEDDEADDEEEYVYDDEGNAYWYDEEYEVWYMYDEDEDDWFEVDVADDGEDAV